MQLVDFLKGQTSCFMAVLRFTILIFFLSLHNGLISFVEKSLKDYGFHCRVLGVKLLSEYLSRLLNGTLLALFQVDVCTSMNSSSENSKKKLLTVTIISKELHSARSR